MTFLKPAWMSENKERAMKAVEKITDKKRLTKAAQNAPLEAVRKKANDALSDLRYKEIRNLVLCARNGMQWAVEALYADKQNWGTIIHQCFSDDILFADAMGNIKTIISKIAFANNSERTGAPVASVCPNYTNGMCSMGNQKCSLRPEWYPVCMFHRSEFFDAWGRETFLKGY